MAGVEVGLVGCGMLGAQLVLAWRNRSAACVGAGWYYWRIATDTPSTGAQYSLRRWQLNRYLCPHGPAGKFCRLPAVPDRSALGALAADEQDRHSDQFHLTHEFLKHMLGCAASALRRQPVCCSGTD
jgi:hypothetical protein